MAGGLDWLLRLDSIAARPGDGLNPKLAELLRARQVPTSPDVVQLQTSFASSGLGHQTYAEEDLTAAGIPMIGTGKGSPEPYASACVQDGSHDPRHSQSQK
ncbi:MAG: hypothetical protein AAGD13_18885 [Pseudomonadota bacterium]